MLKPTFYLFSSFVLSLVVVAGCATPLPPTYDTKDSGRVLEGPILALAGEGDLVAAVNSDGLFVKKGDGPWIDQEVPGIRRFSRSTCLAVDRGVVYLGTDGEGLHILSDGTWEVKTSRYGGLPDDGVLSIAVDGVDDGLPGVSIWVGTRKGIAAFREGEWKVYEPDGDWLVAMTGTSGSGAGKVFVGPGFKLGKRGEDSDRFRPPVSSISTGQDRIVMGNLNSGLAVVSENAVATYRFGESLKITNLAVDEEVIWAGTDVGLLWGGLRDQAQGKPWPTNLAYMGRYATLFGSRDTSDFEYRWKIVGYNTAAVVGMQKEGIDLWVAQRSSEGAMQEPKKIGREMESEIVGNPINDIRRYVNIGEYISRRQRGQYESYGLSGGIKGKPGALYVNQDGTRVWIGTTKGLWELEQY